MQWNQTPCAFLQQELRSVQNQEQTLELRLPEGMPDIGNVICTWGQVLLRSKQWRSDSIQVSGGVSAHVLYAPEEGGEPRSVECWLPIQAKWSLTDPKREGTIRVKGLLRQMDARLLSARKMMVRAGVSLLAEALVPAEGAIFEAPEMPEDVYLLEKTYPLTIPKEAGEKLFLVEEEVSLGTSAARLLSWEMSPVVTEQQVMGSRAVFKGEGKLHLVYMAEDGRLCSETLGVPFAQYAELEGEYDKEASVSSMLALSIMEPDLSGGQVQLKAGVICQYVIYDCRMVKACEDAYSPFRAAEPMIREEAFPVMLDRLTRPAELSQQLQGIQQPVDIAFYPEHPISYREGEDMVLELPGLFQVLGYDDGGELSCITEQTTQRLQIPAGAGCSLCCEACNPESVSWDGSGSVHARMQLELLATAKQEISMVAGVELGEEILPDPMRPTMILRRCEDVSLWELAKGCGSTVEAIRKANHLSADPAPGQMLLIPVC